MAGFAGKWLAGIAALSLEHGEPDYGDLRHRRCADRRRQPEGAADPLQRLRRRKRYQLPEYQRLFGAGTSASGCLRSHETPYDLWAERDEHRPGALTEFQDS